MAFVFTSKNGCSPECRAFGRRWYIKDRHLYGNVYEYCLMSVTTDPQPVYQFADKQALAGRLNNIESFSEKEAQLIDYYYIPRWIKIDCSDIALVEKDGIQYRYDKEKNTLTVLPAHRQESCWYDLYRECLADAKKFLQKLRDNRQAGPRPAQP